MWGNKKKNNFTLVEKAFFDAQKIIESDEFNVSSLRYTTVLLWNTVVGRESLDSNMTFQEANINFSAPFISKHLKNRTEDGAKCLRIAEEEIAENGPTAGAAAALLIGSLFLASGHVKSGAHALISCNNDTANQQEQLFAAIHWSLCGMFPKSEA